MTTPITSIRIVFLTALASALSCSGCDKADTESTSAHEPDGLTGNESTPDVNWITIEAGSFTYGSSNETPCHLPSEEQVAVTLTHPFQIAATELTQAQWEALHLANPSWTKSTDRPVTTINFFEAAVWCNKLSKLEGLDTCYNLENCENEVGVDCINSEGIKFSSCGSNYELAFRCTGDIHRYADRYSCSGYRLPTTAEWEYAAKAGVTDTHTYGGDLHPDTTLSSCSEQPSLEDIAWYCNNSDGEVHPVGQKLPNPWGLYDTLGNVYEWVDHYYGGQPLNDSQRDPPLVDPIGPLTSEMNMKEIRGFSSDSTGCLLRPSAPFAAFIDERSSEYGFRPVRTIFE